MWAYRPPRAQDIADVGGMGQLPGWLVGVGTSVAGVLSSDNVLEAAKQEAVRLFGMGWGEIPADVRQQILTDVAKREARQRGEAVTGVLRANWPLLAVGGLFVYALTRRR